MMLNAGERLDKVEQRLGTVETRLGRVETRLDAVETRLDAVETRPGAVETRLGAVDERLGTLDKDVQKLRVLGEENARQIRLVAEVQVQHGDLLQQIVKDIEPLKAIPDLLKHVVDDHERRITALERRPGS
jgi:archaellum component FlaC